MDKSERVVGAVSGLLLGLLGGFLANKILVSITSGIWSIEKGAPWIAIYAVFIVPAIFGLVYGIIKGPLWGIAVGFFSAFAVGIIDWLACLIIGLFLSGQALTFAIGIVLLLVLFAGPGRIIIVFIGEE